MSLAIIFVPQRSQWCTKNSKSKVQITSLQMPKRHYSRMWRPCRILRRHLPSSTASTWKKLNQEQRTHQWWALSKLSTRICSNRKMLRRCRKGFWHLVTMWRIRRCSTRLRAKRVLHWNRQLWPVFWIPIPQIPVQQIKSNLTFFPQK